MWAVPVALDEHPDDIMLPPGISIVKAISSPVMMPEKAPGIRPCMPEKLMEPVTVDPACVSGHVIVPMPVWPITLPAPMDTDESDALPAHVPAMVAVVPDGDIMEFPPHAAANVNRIAANVFFIAVLSAIRQSFMSLCFIIGHIAIESLPSAMCSIMWLIMPCCIFIMPSRIA